MPRTNPIIVSKGKNLEATQAKPIDCPFFMEPGSEFHGAVAAGATITSVNPDSSEALQSEIITFSSYSDGSEATRTIPGSVGADPIFIYRAGLTLAFKIDAPLVNIIVTEPGAHAIGNGGTTVEAMGDSASAAAALADLGY